jgi:hypothetical protein
MNLAPFWPDQLLSCLHFAINRQRRFLQAVELESASLLSAATRTKLVGWRSMIQANDWLFPWLGHEGDSALRMWQPPLAKSISCPSSIMCNQPQRIAPARSPNFSKSFPKVWSELPQWLKFHKQTFLSTFLRPRISIGVDPQFLAATPHLKDPINQVFR